MTFTVFNIGSNGTLTIDGFRGTVGELLHLAAHEQRHHEIAQRERAILNWNIATDLVINDLLNKNPEVFGGKPHRARRGKKGA